MLIYICQNLSNESDKSYKQLFRDLKPKAWERLKSGTFKEGDQLMYDAKLSPYFRSTLIDNSSKILEAFNYVKESISNLAKTEEKIFESLGKLYLPYMKVLNNKELEKFIQYSYIVDKDSKMNIEELLKEADYGQSLHKGIEKKDKPKLPSLNSIIEID